MFVSLFSRVGCLNLVGVAQGVSGFRGFSGVGSLEAGGWRGLDSGVVLLLVWVLMHVLLGWSTKFLNVVVL